jgi:hypothetical protein
VDLLRAAAIELLACKALKEEESRLRQRRECSILREPNSLAKANAMRDDYNRRKPLAWEALRAALAAKPEPADSLDVIAWQKPGTTFVVHADLKECTNNGHEYSRPLYAAKVESVSAPLSDGLIEAAAHSHRCYLGPGMLSESAFYRGARWAERVLSSSDGAEPVSAPSWRDHVEHRLHSWRQRFVNKSGDQLALDDFMDKESLDDLLDFVLDEWAEPVSATACGRCAGSGTTLETDTTRGPEGGTYEIDCPDCDGTGVRAAEPDYRIECTAEEWSEFSKWRDAQPGPTEPLQRFAWSDVGPVPDPNGKWVRTSLAELYATKPEPGAGSPTDRTSADWRRLTGLWRYGVSVLPPTMTDFYGWLGFLDAAIDERTGRPA